MVRLPIYDNPRDSLDTGDKFFRPISEEAAKDIGRGFASLSAGLAELGEGMQRMQARTEKFQTEKALLDMNVNAERHIDSATQNISESGRNFHNKTMEEIRKQAQATLDAVPETQRAEASIRIQKYLNDKSDELARTEVQQGRAFIKTVTERKVTQLTDNIKNGTWDRNRGVEEVESFLNGAGLPPEQHKVMRDALVRGVESATLERLRTTNPAQFFRETQAYLGNAPTSKAGPIHSLIIEQAKANNIDPVMMLAYAKVESNFNPNSGGTGTIRGLFQLTKAERTRVGRLLGLANPEQMAFDPALQAAAMVILHKEAESRLQANNIPVNPTTLWGHHLLGPAGVLAFMQSDPNADAFTVYARVAGEGIARKAFATNGNILRPGMTVGQVMNQISNRVERAYSEVSQYVSKEPLAGSDGKPMQIMGVQFEFMTPKDLAGNASSAQAEVVKRNEAQIKARQVETMADVGVFNPYDPVHQKTLDESAKADKAQEKIMAGDEAAIARYTTMGRSGYLPKEASQAALALINSANPQQRKVGFEMAASVLRANPTDGLRLSHFGGAMSPDGFSNAAKIRDYVNMTVHGGIDPDEAVRRVSLVHSTDWKLKEADIRGRVETLVKARNWPEIEKSMGLKSGGFLGFGQTNTGPQDKQVRDLMEQKYQQYFRFHYMERGDVEIAKSNAIADLQRSHNFTRVMADTPTMMPYPPERNYPSVKPLPEGKKIEDLTKAELNEHFGYIREQALDVARETARRRGDKRADKIKDVFLVPSGETRADVLQGVPPRYMVFYKDASGERQFAQQEFRASVEIARGRVSEESSGERVSRPATQAPELTNAKDRFRAQRKEDDSGAPKVSQKEPPKELTGERYRDRAGKRVSSNVEDMRPAPEFAGVSDDQLLERYNEIGRAAKGNRTDEDKARQRTILFEMHRRGMVDLTDRSAAKR